MWYVLKTGESVLFQSLAKNDSVGILEDYLKKQKIDLKKNGKIDRGVYKYNDGAYYVVFGESNRDKYVPNKNALDGPIDQTPPIDETPKPVEISFEEDLKIFLDRVIKNNNPSVSDSMGGQYAKGNAVGMYECATHVYKLLEKHGI